MAKNGKPGRGHNSGMVWLIRRYNSIETDPEGERVRALLRKEHLKDSDIAALGGLALSTVSNLRGGKTMRPQFATLAKITGGMGFKYQLVREEQPNYEREIPKAREQRRAYFNMRKKS